MRKSIFIIASFFSLNLVQGSEISKFIYSNVDTVNFNNSEPITFVENGVIFYVFTDGQFDFDTNLVRDNIIYRSGRRSVDGRFGNNFSNFRSILIEEDNSGRIRRIGNVFISYDYLNRIRRIGSVNMFYNRFALSQIGGLRLFYNRFGDIIDAYGVVNAQQNWQSGSDINFNFFEHQNNNNGNLRNNGNVNNGYYNNKNRHHQSENGNSYKNKHNIRDKEFKDNFKADLERGEKR